MDKDLHNIEELFRSSLNENEEEIPSKNVWDAVDKQLDKDNVISIKRKYTFLKRIAVLLLLLLSIALFELNTSYKNNGSLAKNKNTGEESESKSNKKNDTDINNTTKINAAAAMDKAHNNTNKKQNPTISNPLHNDKKSTNDKKVVTINSHTLQKQNSTEIITAEKDNSNNQSSGRLTRKKKINTSLAYHIKIKNSTPSEDKQLLVQNNAEGDIFPSLRNRNIVSFETLQMDLKDSANTKKISASTSSLKVNVYDSSNKTVLKTTPEKLKNLSRFSITPFFSPDIAWYRLLNDKAGYQQENANEIEKEEKHEFSYTFGLLVNYKINKQWGLQSGLTVSNTNIIIQPKTIYAQPDNTGSIKYRINTSSGYGYVLPSYISSPVTGDSLYAFTSTHSLQYIGIPLAVSYNITRGKFNLNTVAGISANFLTSAKLATSVENGIDNSTESVNSLQGVKKVYFSGLAGIGVDYKLTNKTALTFAPVMRFALNPINKDATVKSYPMSLGFAVGLKINL